MRGSFGGGGGRMGGGPGGGGGSMMRAVGRVAARAGVRGSGGAGGGGGGGHQDPFSSANSAPTSPRKDAGKDYKTLSLSSSSVLGVPLSGPSPWPPFHHDEEYFWVPFHLDEEYLPVLSDGSDECEDGKAKSEDDSAKSEDDSANVLEISLLGPVPSGDEVDKSISAIQHWATTPQFIRDRFGPNLDIDACPPSNDAMMHHVSSKGSDLDWTEPALYLSNSKSLSPYGYGSERALDAFQLLRTDSSVQKMVVSLSQDRAVWDAILNNEVVRELRESCLGGAADVVTDEAEGSEESSKESDTNPVVDVVMQMFGHTKAKFADMIEKIAKLVTHLFNPPSSSSTSDAATSGPGDLFEAKVRASFMLTVVVLLTVIISRARGA